MSDAASSSERIYYDGDCGVCHWAVAFVARRDRRGEQFRFAPLGGETFLATVAEARRQNLPDSLIVQRQSGDLLWRSAGLVYILCCLGGFWAVLGRLLGWVPRPLRDLFYDRFAAIRSRLTRQPEGACPLLPPELAARFDP